MGCRRIRSSNRSRTGGLASSVGRDRSRSRTKTPCPQWAGRLRICKEARARTLRRTWARLGPDAFRGLRIHTGPVAGRSGRPLAAVRPSPVRRRSGCGGGAVGAGRSRGCGSGRTRSCRADAAGSRPLRPHRLPRLRPLARKLEQGRWLILRATWLSPGLTPAARSVAGMRVNLRRIRMFRLAKSNLGRSKVRKGQAAGNDPS